MLTSRCISRPLRAYAATRRGKLMLRIFFMLLAAIAAPGAAAAAAADPVLDPRGADDSSYGRPQNYPLPPPFTSPQPATMVGFYSHYDQVRTLRPVRRAGEPSVLRRATAPLSLQWQNAGSTTDLEDYLARTPVTGLLIARGDTILYEHYRYARSDTDRFLSQSMVKTITGLLVGIAVSEGRIRSIDDTAATYVPELAGSEYGATPIRALLRMTSGVQYRETYQPGDDSEKLGSALFPRNAPGAVAAVRQFDTRIAPPGARYYYAGAETEVLGLVVARAAGQSLSDYLSSRIWGPMGMEADAAWATDPTGQEIAYCCFVARLRDWARLALMLANDGAWDGRQIVPRQWLIDSTTSAPDAPGAPGRITGGRGYGNQVWLLPGERRGFALFGIHGQRIFVDPATRLVLVQTAVFQPAGGPTLSEAGRLWQELLHQVSK